MGNEVLYEEFKKSITNKKLKVKLDTYSERLQEVYSNEDIRRGLLMGSKI